MHAADAHSTPLSREVVTDLLQPDTPVSLAPLRTEGLQHASAAPVASAAAGVRLLATAQSHRVHDCAEPGSAHVLVQLSLSGGGKLLLVESARTDAIEERGGSGNRLANGA